MKFALMRDVTADMTKFLYQDNPECYEYMKIKNGVLVLESPEI